MNIWFKGTSHDIGIDFQTQCMYDAIQEKMPDVMEAEKTIGKGLIYSQEVEGRVSFAQTEENIRPTATRILTKLGKYIKKHLKISKYTDAELAGYVELILSAVKYHIEITEGDYMYDAYMESYGNTSCMTGSEHQDKIAMYAENPDIVKILLYKSGNQKARALLWLLDDDDIFIDRVYTSTCSYDDIREKMAKKVRELYPNRRLIGRRNDSSDTWCMEHRRVKKVKLFTPSTGEYPYADAFASVLEHNEDDETVTVATGDYDYWREEGANPLGYMWCTCGGMTD